MGNTFESVLVQPLDFSAVNGLKPFFVTSTLHSLSAATPVIALADSNLGAGQSAYLENYRATVSGGVGWLAITSVQITDNTGAVLVTIPILNLVGNALLGPFTTGITNAASYSQSTGTTMGSGLRIVANANGSAGSDLIFTLSGYIK